MFFTYILFAFAYFGLCNWIQIYYLLRNSVKPKRQMQTVDGKGLLPKIKQKTGLEVTIQTMSEHKKMIGFMVSSPPFKPIMIFSEKLYSAFTSDEFEWVALHESAHYLMWHNAKMALSQLSLFIIGIILIFKLQIDSIYLIIPLTIIVGIIYIRVAVIFEYQADNYAVTHVDNPRGMISGNKKMIIANKPNRVHFILRHLIYTAVPYEERIKMAERQLKLSRKYQ